MQVNISGFLFTCSVILEIGMLDIGTSTAFVHLLLFSKLQQHRVRCVDLGHPYQLRVYSNLQTSRA